MMYGEILIYAGAALSFIWGLAHLFPTKSVVHGFGDISPDNKNIIAMEWIVEGIALIFIGLPVAILTYLDPSATTSKAAYILSSIVLISLAIVSLFTGFGVTFLPFKLCPTIFTSSAILVALGWLVIGQTSGERFY